MEKEFVPVHIAHELKDLGFDEECIAVYSEGELLINELTFCKRDMSKLVKLESSYGVLIVEVNAETYEQADIIAKEMIKGDIIDVQKHTVIKAGTCISNNSECEIRGYCLNGCRGVENRIRKKHTR